MWYIPINKIEIRANQYFIPLSSINAYRKQNYFQTKHLIETNNAKEKTYDILQSKTETSSVKHSSPNRDWFRCNTQKTNTRVK